MSNDQPSLDAFLDIIKTWILQKETLIAIKEGTKEIAGLMVGQIVSKTSSMDVYKFLKVFMIITVVERLISEMYRKSSEL